ncbi:MAG: ABC transporter permease [Chromatiales bacterium]|nr:MAG: ABC transporter permease [Chromatiales bacterium]
MNHVLYLAWRYLVFNRWKTGILIAAITVILFLPLALELVLDRSSERLRARAIETPLLLGAPGSPLELVLGALYFDSEPPATLEYGVTADVTASGLATAIPLHLGHRVAGQPVVGTSPDYFTFRQLRIAAGRPAAISGEAVLGAAAAQALQAGPGDGVVTAPETVFDVTGTYPIRLNVVGVLAPTGTPDDQAVFVDMRTAWIIGGIGHGHEDLGQPEASGSVLKRDGENIVANAAVAQYREITAENLGEFHFHGDIATFPASAIITVPVDQKSGVLLEGRYQEPDAPVRIARPVAVMDELLATVFTVRQYVLAAVALVGLATLATIALVFLLSIRLRRAEITTMTRIGAAPGRVAAILGAEILLVLVASLMLAGLLTALATAWGDELFRWILLA